MDTIIVLAMHGSPPKDFPNELKKELFMLHGRIEGSADPPGEDILKRYNELENEMRLWPRTPENDPYHFASTQMAKALEIELRLPVILGFNEFCGPSLSTALEECVSKGYRKVIVTTPMMTRGGEHAGKEIPELINEAARAHYDIEFKYAWPFSDKAIGRFLSEQIKDFV